MEYGATEAVTVMVP